MVNNSDRELDLVFHALSDKTRRSMLARLAKGECNVTELAEPYDLTLAGVSKHLKVLEEANFVEKTREGRSFRCRANLEPLDRVQAMLEDLGAFWRKQLDSLDRYLSAEELNTGEKRWQSKRKRTRRQKSS